MADPRAAKPERTDTLTMETPMTDGTRAAFGGFIGAVIGGFLMDGMGVAVGVAVGVSLGVLLGSDREWAPPDFSSMPRRITDSLRHDEETIRQRLADIDAREKRLGEVRQRVSGQDDESPASERWRRVRDAIDSAATSLARQRDRYHVKLWEIALVRWQNTLEPLYSDWESLTHDACNQRLRQLEVAQERGAVFLTDWEGVDISDLPEAERCLDRLREALAACDQLREALIVQQAALAVKGIAPMDDALNPHLAPAAALQSLDAFNARASLGEFTAAFDELEAEYSRLRSEEELAEKATLIQRLR
jgi:hypothetical protein